MTKMLREISSLHLSHKCKLFPSLGWHLRGQSESREVGVTPLTPLHVRSLHASKVSLWPWSALCAEGI